MAKKEYIYNANIIRVIDGDTYEAKVDLGFSIAFNLTIRLNNIDTPEVYGPKKREELAHGLHASARIRALLEGKDVVIKTEKTSAGIYGRYGADVAVGGFDVRQFIIDNHLEKRDNYKDYCPECSSKDLKNGGCNECGAVWIEEV